MEPLGNLRGSSSTPEPPSTPAVAGPEAQLVEAERRFGRPLQVQQGRHHHDETVYGQVQGFGIMSIFFGVEVGSTEGGNSCNTATNLEENFKDNSLRVPDYSRTF